MPVPTSAVYLHLYGWMDGDPTNALDARANTFLTSRQWTTDQTFYHSLQEPIEANVPTLWFVGISLGLDHIKGTSADWCADVIALMKFFQTVQSELGNEFHVEVEYISKWYSEPIMLINENSIDYPLICEMIKRVVP